MSNIMKIILTLLTKLFKIIHLKLNNYKLYIEKLYL